MRTIGALEAVEETGKKKAKKTLHGGLEHAVLSICAPDEGEVEEKKNETVAASGLISSIASAATGKIKKIAESKFPEVADFVKDITKNVNFGRDWKNFEVQFNPQTLSLQTASENEESKKDLGAKTKKLKHFPHDACITLSMKLIFDETNLVNVQNAVQKSVEGLMYAVGTLSLCGVVFTWGDLSYEGFLNDVSAKYTMYDMTGRPMRAEVDLRMDLIGIFAGRQAADGKIISYWKDEYYDFMKGIDTQNRNHERGEGYEWL